MQDKRRPVVAVVDDDEAVRESFRFLLEAAGFSVVTFPSAASFLTRPDAAACNRLLLDQHMPIMTGLDLLQQLRAAGRELPVAIMTGSPSAQLTQRALELGAVAVLEKPLAEDALLRFLQAPGG